MSEGLAKVLAYWKHDRYSRKLPSVHNFLARLPAPHPNTDTIIRVLELTLDFNVFAFNHFPLDRKSVV